MRRKAGQESPGVIDQPCLVILGTAIPNHYYQALIDTLTQQGTVEIVTTPRAGWHVRSYRLVEGETSAEGET